MRLCKCGRPSAQQDRKKQRATYCRPCWNAINNKNAKKRYTPEERRRKLLKENYGLTPEAYSAMVDVQGNLCAICNQPESRRALAVDHNHKTGKIRSLLCDSCNMGLGKFNDDPSLIQRAIEYLARHN